VVAVGVRLETGDDHAMAIGTPAPASWAVVALHAADLDEIVVAGSANVVVADAVGLLRSGCGMGWTMVAALRRGDWLGADVTVRNDVELNIIGFWTRERVCCRCGARWRTMTGC
jgi:hypothetical protein